MTADELLHVRIPDKRVELVRGVLVVREPAGYTHGRVVMSIAIRLGTHAERTAAGRLVAAAKVADWLSAGVRLVWVVDPQRRLARVYREDGTETLVSADQDDVHYITLTRS